MTESVPLSRERVLRAALRYVDAHGLAALSMHKLGAELGVRAMSLYYHVQNKDDVLDGLVDVLWSEIDPAAIEVADWRAATRGLARALREVVHRHPRAAPLLTTRQVSSAAALRVYAAYLSALESAGFERVRALELLRVLIGFGLGYATTELNWRTPPAAEPADPPRRMAQADTADATIPPDLLTVAADICRDADTGVHFDLGVDLLLRGMEQGHPPAEP